MEKVQQHETRVEREARSELPVNWNLSHLTLSDIAQEFFKSDPRLRDLGILGDQIIATNYLDQVRVNFYKASIDELMLTEMINSDEADPVHGRLEKGGLYLQAVIDGSYLGYRGKLATEVRRSYRVEEDEKETDRRWSIMGHKVG